jgi:hypothetical protein
MPRDGAITFSDLIGKLDVLHVECEKCARDGRYRLSRLIQDRGRDAKVTDWLDQITADCPKRAMVSWNDRCRHGVRIYRGCFKGLLVVPPRQTVVRRCQNFSLPGWLFRSWFCLL